MHYAAARSLRALAIVPFAGRGFVCLEGANPWAPRMFPSTTAGESSNRARSCTQ
jgi:hypothetical protein